MTFLVLLKRSFFNFIPHERAIRSLTDGDFTLFHYRFNLLANLVKNTRFFGLTLD